MAQVLSPIGFCIYCGREPDTAGPLTREHIIPEALNGDLILPDASCKPCCVVTSRFELQFARTMYGSVRWREGFQSKRNRRKREHTRPVLYYDAKGTETTVQVHADQYPGLYLAPVLSPPGYLTGAEPTDLNPPFELVMVGDLSQIDAIRNGAPHLGLKQSFDWNAFNRTLAKIALGFAYHVHPRLDPWLRDIILGKSGAYSHLIGGRSAIVRGDQDYGAVSLVGHNGKKLVMVELYLLGGRLGPYDVIAGELE